MTEVTLSKVDTDMVDIMWCDIKPLIEIALEHANGEITIEWMYEQIKAGDMLLFLVCRDNEILSAITFEKRTFDSGKDVLVITTAGGSSLYDWMDLVLDKANEVAKDSACSDVYVIGRKGWGKPLKERGYDYIHTVFSKKVI